MSLSIPSPRQPRRAWIASSALIALMFAWSVPAFAQAPLKPELSLSQASKIALEQNIPLLIAKLDQRLGQISARQARRPYVPTIQLRAAWQDDTNLIQGGRNRSLAYQGQLAWTLPVGTSLSAQAGATDYLAGSSFAPTPATFIQFALVQPLLQDLGAGSLQLKQRDMEVELQRAVFLDVLNSFLLDLEVVYWELAFAQANLDIAIRSRDRAKQQFEDTQENIRRRLIAPGEIHLVEENLVFFEQQLVRAQETLELAQVRLARQLRADESTPWVAADALATAVESLPDPEQLKDSAFEANPLLLSQRLRVKQAEYQVDLEANQIKPSLDLEASVRLNGTDASRATAWGQAATAQSPDYRVGLQFGVPLQRDPDYARVERAQVERKRQEHQLTHAQDRVRYSIRELYIQLKRRQEVLVLSERGVALAELKLQNEQEKYKSGASTLANVVLFQRDFDRARNAYQRAVADVLITRSRLRQQVGDLYLRAGLKVS